MKEDSSENIFTKEDSERDLRSNSVIIDNNTKLNLDKSLIDNLDESSENREDLNDKSLNTIIKRSSLRTQSVFVPKKKKSFDSSFNKINKKRKSIYFGDGNDAVKLNVMGSEGICIYEKMNNYVNKYNKKEYFTRNSLNEKYNTKKSNISNYNVIRGIFFLLFYHSNWLIKIHLERIHFININ